MKTDLKDSFKYFIENHDSLFEEYPNKFVVIHEKTVVLSKDSFVEAYEAAISNGYDPGTFLIQECTAGDSAYTQFFASQISFA